MSQRKYVVSSLVIIAAIVIFFSLKTSINNKVLEKVTIGFLPSPPMAILMVAKEKGFFDREGLDVQLKEFTAGKFALAAFFGGSLDFAVSGDVPPLLAALQGNEFVVPAQLVKNTKGEVRVVATKDGGINDAKTYFSSKKRKLATSFGGGPEFFTYEFLNSLGISKDQVEVVSQKPEDMVPALASASVDAIAIFDPVAYFAEKQMGEKAISFVNESVYSELYVIEAHKSIKNNPEQLNKLVRALIKAEKYLKDNINESRDIVAKYTKLDRSAVDSVWNSIDFGISLTPELINNWNKQVDWAKNTGKINKDAKIPNLSDYIYSESLMSILPGAVIK